MSKPPHETGRGGGGCPMHAEIPGLSPNGEPRVYGKNELTYNNYLKIPELLSLQIPQSDPAHHDELLFIVIHQAYELWFKLILHELDQTIAHMLKSEVLKAHHFIKRACEIMRILVPQIHILETMTPKDFSEFRDRLNPASGFQSLQFREVEFMAGLKDERYYHYFKHRPEMIDRLRQRHGQIDLRSSYYQMLRDMGFALPEDPELDPQGATAAILPIYQKPSEHLPLYLLSESLVEFDEFLQLWREHHVRVVERIIGFKTGTGGSSGVEYLKSTTAKKCFPLLWEVRTHIHA